MTDIRAEEDCVCGSVAMAAGGGGHTVARPPPAARRHLDSGGGKALLPLRPPPPAHRAVQKPDFGALSRTTELTSHGSKWRCGRRGRRCKEREWHIYEEGSAILK